jgi:hypothetical protein
MSETEPEVPTIEVPDFPGDADVREDVGAVLALDVGQLQDPSCLCAVRCWATSAWLRNSEPTTVEQVVLARQRAGPPAPRGKIWSGKRWVAQPPLPANWQDAALGIEEVKRRSFDLVALDSFSLGTPFTTVARATARALRHPALQGRRDERGRWVRPAPMLVIDSTAGIGGVLDLLREQGLDWRTLVPLTLTGSGDTEHRTSDARVAVPKRLLVGALRNQLLAGRFRVAADLPEAAAFVSELQNFEASISPTGHDRYEGRAGTHDDRVMAAAMAVWWGLQRPLPAHAEYTIVLPGALSL